MAKMSDSVQAAAVVASISHPIITFLLLVSIVNFDGLLHVIVASTLRLLVHVIQANPNLGAANVSS